MIPWIAVILLSLRAIPETFSTVKSGICNIGLPLLLMWLVGDFLMLVSYYDKLPLLTNYALNVVCVSTLLFFKLRGANK